LKGHDFSRAEETEKTDLGLWPLRDGLKAILKLDHLFLGAAKKLHDYEAEEK
jgi:hypothetical protein